MPHGTLLGGFTYVAPVTVLGVISTTGPTVGGVSVTVWGTEFQFNAAVTFGGSSATSCVTTSINTITCIIPAHAAGAVTVVVTNPDATTGSMASAFTYVVAAPTVTEVRPAIGATTGAENVIVTGTGFVAGATVKFAASLATGVVFISTTTLSCITPAHGAGFVDVTVTNPDTQTGFLFSGFEYQTVAPYTDTKGWWYSSDSFAGGTNIVVTPANPQHARHWDKIVGFATGGAAMLGGSPAASVIYRNHMIYAGDDYTLGTTNPSIRIFDGLADRLMLRIPNTSTGTAPKGIISMLLVGDIIYVSTFDSGTTSADYAGRVFSFDPLAGTISLIATAFTGGEVPYALAWHMNRLWVGTNQGDGTASFIYWFRPNIDTAWTVDYSLATSTVGGACSMRSFQGKLYIGTDNVGASRGKVLVRSSDATYATSDTGTGGAAVVNNGYLSMVEFGGNLYASYWNADAPSVSLIKKFDGSSWSTVYTGATVTIRPFIVLFSNGTYIFGIGGGSSLAAALVRSSNGTSWDNLTAYLAGPITETALPAYGLVS